MTKGLAQDSLAHKWQSSGLLILMLVFFPLRQMGGGWREFLVTRHHGSLSTVIEKVNTEITKWSPLGQQEVLLGHY